MVRIVAIFAAISCLTAAWPAWSKAVAQSSSSSYKIDEFQFGSGGELDATSGSYRAHSAVGGLGVGDFASTNYDGVGGYITPNEPFLEMLVTAATVDFGVLSDSIASSAAAQAGACNCSFTVRTYLTSTYSVLSLSDPPTNESGAVIDAKTTLGVPSTNQAVEEFGINLVDNSSPNVGVDPLNVPSGSLADGEAASGYGTPNQFKYAVGDTIARSQQTATNQAVGQTNYTISYIAKRRSLTEAGVYQMNHMLVVVPTF